MKTSILNQCLKFARMKLKSHSENYKHFSFIVQKNKVVDWGINNCKEMPAHFGYRKSSKTHAEVAAYFKAKGIMQDGDFEIVNIRLNNDGWLRNSKPCDCCYRLLKALGCKRFYYSTNLGFKRC